MGRLACATERRAPKFDPSSNDRGASADSYAISRAPVQTRGQRCYPAHMQTSTLLAKKVGAVAWLTLNRPDALNALTEELVSALGDRMLEANHDPEVRVVVLRGAGGHFCSGLDLKRALPPTLDEHEVVSTIARFQSLIRAIVEADKPYVACVEGAAVGFGADLALACDFRVLGRSGYLQEKFVDIGLMPDGGGTFWLPHLVGLGRALEILMLARRIDADQALALGLATQVAADTELEHAAQTLAEELCHKAPLALASVKAAVRRAIERSLSEALEREQAGQARLLLSHDFREGVRAWSERRPAKFTGK